jgi:hypothetical protein
MDKKKQAIKWIMRELVNLRLAPSINGCEETEEWRQAREALETALAALEGKHE